MTAVALTVALQLAARLASTRALGVDLRQELRNVQGKEQQLKLISHGYEPKTIALTFDDGPHAGKTESLLKLLKQLDLKATFFVVGKMVDRNPDLVRQELAEGHEVWNHTYNHPNLDNLTEPQVAQEYQA